MLGLIKILNDSVVLYQNWINQDEWEHIYSFPHGGLTFKIANDNIKFFATKDYFYRNLICSFDFPVHIIDEINDIDGEYSDEDEIAEILNRIYPLEQTSGVDLRLYLKKSEAEELYYDKDEIDDKLDGKADKDDVYTKEETDAILDGFYTKQETDLLLDQKADAGDVYTKEEVDDKLDDKANKDDVYTKAQSDAKYQPKGDYVSATTLDNYYTKAQSDAKYLTEHQPIKTINHQSLIGTGNIDISGGSITVDSVLSTASTNPVQNKVITNALNAISAKTDNTYTKAQADAKFISEIKTINHISLIGSGNIDIGSGGTIDIDTYLSPTSTNPVENRVIYSKFNDYYTKAEVQALINTMLSNYYTKSEADAKFCPCGGDEYTLTVNTNIAADITINGTTYSNTRSASKQLSSGASYTVSFGEVSGYAKPGNMTGIITASKTLTGTYTAIGNIKAKLTLNNGNVVEIPGSGMLYAGETWAYSANTVSAEIGSGCTEFSDDGNFKGFSNLTSAIITSPTNNIGCYAFKNCSNLTSVTISSSVTMIKTYAFENCTNLTNITIPNSVTRINDYAFKGCSGLINFTLPNTITYLGQGSFSDCSSLTGITIPNTIRSIGTFTFSNCTGMTSLVMPNSITNIERYAFSNCRSLTSVTLPSSITTIGDSAFYHCNSLASVTVNATTPPTLGTSTFSSTNNCPIYVPAASVNAYKTAENWSNYASRITAIP